MLEFDVGDLVWVQVREQLMFPKPVAIEKIYEHGGKKGYYVEGETTGFVAEHLTLATEQAPPDPWDVDCARASAVPVVEGSAGCPFDAVKDSATDADIAKDFEAAPAAPAGPDKGAAAASPRLEPDRPQIELFVDGLFRYAGDKGFVAIRSFYEGADKAFRLSPTGLSGGLKFLVDVAEDDARRAAQNPTPVVFAPPICVFAGKDRAREEDVLLGLTLSVECDEHPQQARATLEALLGHATIVVASGGIWVNGDGESELRLHLHWRLKEPAQGRDNLAKLKTARELAARLVGADPSCAPICHPLRWPGSLHRKGEPRLVEIVAAFDIEVDLDEVLALLRDAAGAGVFDAAGGPLGIDGTPKPPHGEHRAYDFWTMARLRAPNHAAVVAALAVIPNDNRDWVEWNHFGMAIWAATGGSELGGETFAAWSAQARKNDPGTTAARWRHYAASPPNRLGFGTLVHWARHYSPGWTYAGPDGEKSRAAPEADDEGVEGPAGADALGVDEVDRLVEKTKTDPGAAFAPEMCQRLAALKASDRAAFEALRARLKGTGCRVTALDEAIAAQSGDVGGRRPTQADILIDLAQTAELFHAPDGTGFADLDVNGHRETWPIRAKGFRRWLARCFFEATGGAPSSEALQSALNVIEAKAHFDAPERVVHIRVGGLGGKLYLDLCDATWRAVEIDAIGWRVIDNPPVRFRRAAGMKPLPVPVAGGSIEVLRSFLNVKSDHDFILVVAWALAVLRNRGPYPVIVLSGEQGSAKSTFSAILRRLLDPNTAPLRALPREDRDLFIAASNGHVLAFDNVSSLPAWISDTLCRLATGGGFAVRQLYTDGDEVLFDAERPVILNGIEEIVTRPDLADRAVFLTLEPIPEDRRRPESELWAAFEAERPRVLGVLLDAVAKGLAELPRTKFDKLPRMADFALWATACETGLRSKDGTPWPQGTFWAAYSGNRDEAIEGVIDADPVATAVRAFMAKQAAEQAATQTATRTMRTVWTGIASDLLGALAEVVGERITKSKTWPDSPRALSGRLRRAATFLRKVDIDIAFTKEGRARTRTITITATFPAPGMPEEFASASSASSANSGKANSGNGFSAQSARTQTGDADANSRRADGSGQGDDPTVRANPLKSNAADGADGADANIPPQSAAEKTGEAPGWSARL